MRWNVRVLETNVIGSCQVPKVKGQELGFRSPSSFAGTLLNGLRGFWNGGKGLYRLQSRLFGLKILKWLYVNEDYSALEMAEWRLNTSMPLSK
ncbi:MAG: hypothetical protein ACTS41_01190 [Candidatus Hodgkinia cicadicola]